MYVSKSSYMQYSSKIDGILDVTDGNLSVMVHRQFPAHVCILGDTIIMRCLAASRLHVQSNPIIRVLWSISNQRKWSLQQKVLSFPTH